MPPKKAAKVAKTEEKVKEMGSDSTTTAATAAPAQSNKDGGLLAAIAYLLGVLAIVLYFIKPEDKFVRFHSLQALAYNVAVGVIFIALSIGLMLISIVSGGVGGILGFCMIPIAGIALIYDLYAAYMAFTGKMYKMPVIGELVAKYV